MASPMAKQMMGLASRPSSLATPRSARSTGRPALETATSPRVKTALQDHVMSEIEHAEHVEQLKKAHALELERKDAQHSHEREKAKVLVLHAETQASFRARKEELAAQHAQTDLIAAHERELARLRATLERECERKEAACKAKLAAETAAFKNCTMELEEKNQEVEMLRATVQAVQAEHTLELARQQVRSHTRRKSP